MCEIHRYTTVHSDGSREKTWSSRLCPVGERHRKPCSHTKEFKHPVNERYTGSNVTSFYTTPPSPPSSDSSFPLSGNEGEGSRKKRSGIYVNDQKVMDIGRKPSRREKRHSDHIIIVDPPAAQPSSPRLPVITPILKPSSPPTHHASSARPVQYPSHPRPEVRVEVGGSGHGHRRQSSHSSHQSRDSVSDEERRVRKLKRELEKAEEAVRMQRVQTEISRQNEAIASRPAVPSAPNPLARPYRRPSVSVRRPDQELTDALHQLRVSEQTMADAERERRRQARRADEKRQAQEDEAQKQRLRERMTPASQRRPTKIMYPDGTYRYEF